MSIPRGREYKNIDEEGGSCGDNKAVEVRRVKKKHKKSKTVTGKTKWCHRKVDQGGGLGYGVDSQSVRHRKIENRRK